MIWRPIVERTACLENYILPTTVLFHSSTVQLSLTLTTSSSRWRLSKILYTLNLKQFSADRNISQRATNNGLTVCQYNSFHMWSEKKYFDLPAQRGEAIFIESLFKCKTRIDKCTNAGTRLCSLLSSPRSWLTDRLPTRFPPHILFRSFSVFCFWGFACFAAHIANKTNETSTQQHISDEMLHPKETRKNDFWWNIPRLLLSHCYLCYHFDKDKIIIVGEIKDLQHKIWDEAAREENIQTSNSTPCPAAVACTLFHKPSQTWKYSDACTLFHKPSQTCSAHFFKPSVSRLKFDTHLKQAQSKRSVACPTWFLPNPSDLTQNFFATFLSENGVVQSYREALKFHINRTFNGDFYRGEVWQKFKQLWKEDRDGWIELRWRTYARNWFIICSINTERFSLTSVFFNPWRKIQHL